MTIRSKLIVTNLVVFGIILIAVAIAVYNRTRDSEIARIDSRLDTFAAAFVTEFEDQWENDEFPDSDELEELMISPLADARIELVDEAGTVRYRRSELPGQYRDLIAAAFNGRSRHRTIDVAGEPFRLVVHPVETDDSIHFALLMATPVEEIEDRLANLMMVLIVSMLGALLLTGLSVYYLTGRAFRPVTEMVDAAERISAATLDHRLTVPSARDEVSRLAESLNAMMARIEDAFKSQRRFVSDASHELRTPLTVIYGELEFLKRRINEIKLKESVSTIMHEIDGLAHLIDQLLVLARLDASKLIINPEPVRLDELLADSIRVLESSTVGHSVGIKLQVDDVVETVGNHELLKRTVLNVLDNAVKYSPDGAEVAVNLQRDGAQAVVTVSDRGPGIDPSEVEQVFHRFYRSPRVRQTHDGSGLGLAIARELIEAHGGHVRIAASGDHGTTVEIRLALLPPDKTTTSTMA